MPRTPPTKPSSGAPAKVAPAAPAPAWQTAATVLLILHLFCVSLGLVTNVAGGKSLLSPALFRIPLAQQYLKLLWMNVGYDFYVASPLPEDGSHRLQLSAADADDTSQLTSLPAEMPTDSIEPRIRRQRYQQLAYHVAFLDELYAENSDIRTMLPLAIAERWLRELKAPQASYVLACLREPSKRLPKAVERAPSKPREGGPRLAGPTTYATETITIHLVWDPESAGYQASRTEPTGQTSEVVHEAAPIENDVPLESGEPASAGGSAAIDSPTPGVAPAIDPADAK